MKRANEKISDAIRTGKKPRRRQRARVINLATIDMTEEERIAMLEAGRERLADRGWVTDCFGRVMW